MNTCIKVMAQLAASPLHSSSVPYSILCFCLSGVLPMKVWDSSGISGFFLSSKNMPVGGLAIG